MFSDEVDVDAFLQVLTSNEEKTMGNATVSNPILHTTQTPITVVICIYGRVLARNYRKREYN